MTMLLLPALCQSTRIQMLPPPDERREPLPANVRVMPTLDTVQCCKAEDLLTSLPDASIDLIVTSPPYDNLRTYKGFTWDFETIARQSYRVLKAGGVLVWVVGDGTVNGGETLTSARQALYFVDCVGFTMHDTMIYSKDAAFPETNRYYPCFEYMYILSRGKPRVANLLTQPNKYGGQRIYKTEREADGRLVQGIGARLGRTLKENGVLPNVWYISSGFNKATKDHVAFEHPAIFPEELARRHILTWSNPGDVVLDYFGGSGTTAKIARALGRHYITCDISAEYCDLMRRRLAAPYTPPLFAAPSPPPAHEQLRLMEV